MLSTIVCMCCMLRAVFALGMLKMISRAVTACPVGCRMAKDGSPGSMVEKFSNKCNTGRLDTLN